MAASFRPNTSNEERKYARRRAELVALLREKGISDPLVLEAIGRVPRHTFLDDILKHRAYEDEALPIGLQQTISQPYTVAFQTQALALRPGDRVLEIGTGSGYQAAILCEMGVQVFTVERHRPLLERALDVLKALGYRVSARLGDGTLGWLACAPFDGILVTAGANDIPTALQAQLRTPGHEHPGGRLLVPVGSSDGQVMHCVTRITDQDYAETTMGQFRFVPLVGKGTGGHP
ncbi:MAG: protein-L-isoaspartate(D-aspartate) O-methyltransferase [Bacteroidetes bacterium]|jgi:protein-L-isoaspartate(D-aspartate) O-methyltransferase|nr:protein-L-isoaspartate(D-aspartate) O-methyltransferase [Bacteroidota bacterium]